MRDTTAHLVNIVISYNFVVDDYVLVRLFVCLISTKLGLLVYIVPRKKRLTVRY